MMDEENSMSRFHFYPNKWKNKSEDCDWGILQNINGEKPSSCEEIELNKGTDPATECSKYKGYYMNEDDDGHIQSYAYYICRKNHGLGDNACVKDLLTPAYKICQPTPFHGSAYTDKMYYNNMGWLCQKTANDNRTGLDFFYRPVNPIIKTDAESIANETSIDFNNMCGNVWGSGFNNRCTPKDNVIWPDCVSLKNKDTCEGTDGCRWFLNTDGSYGDEYECQIQTCPDMARHDLVCSSQLCDWDRNPEGSENITGPKGDPPRGYNGPAPTPGPYTYNCKTVGGERVCVATSGSSGKYPDSESCEEKCNKYTWKCQGGDCVPVWSNDDDSPGPYQSEADCVKSGCNAAYTFNCSKGMCKPVEGRYGQYTSEEACLRKCAGKCCPDLDNPGVVPPGVCTSITDPQQCVMDGCKLQNHCEM